jgi:ATP-dependent helicase/nuclease subunit A
MRILYVAMTRAINHLVLVGCIDKNTCENKLNSASFFENQTVPDWYLDSCQSHLDWLLCGLGTIVSEDNLFSVQFYDQPQLNNLSAFIQNIKHIKPVRSTQDAGRASQDLARLQQSLDYQYPFGDAPLLPAKRTVSQWTHRNDEFTKFDYSSSFNRMPKAVLPSEKVDGKSVGSAAHLVMSLLDLSRPITIDSITALIKKLVAGGAIAESVAPLINAESILKFFQTDLGRAALDTCSPGRKNNLVWREWPFTFAVPASQWSESEALAKRSEVRFAKRSGVPFGGRSPLLRSGVSFRRDETDDSIIIQGIIDLLIKTPKGLVVIDFKTDDVHADSAPKRAEIYRTQLDLYARAASAITGQTVLSKWLYFLSPGSKIQI